MKSVIYKFDPVIYPFPLLVSKDFVADELKDMFYILTSDTEAEEAGDSFDPTPTTAARTARVIDKQNMNVYFLVTLFTPNSVPVGIIAHEAFHTNSYNCDLLGIPGRSPDTDEPQAYFTQWVAECIHSVITGEQEKLNAKLFER